MPDLIGPNGSPIWVPKGEEKTFLRLGYRLAAPINEVTPTPHATEMAQKMVPPKSNKVNVNTAELKELTFLPKITTAIARATVQNRPYNSIEDLIEKVSDFDWVAVEPRLEF